MRRRVLLGVTVLTLAMGVGLCCFLYTGLFRSWLGEEISARASRALGRRTEAKVEGFRPHSLEIELAELRVAGDREDGEPLVAVGRVHADGRWAALLRGRLELESLWISDPRVVLGAARGEPSPTSEQESWSLGPVRVRSLEVEGGTLRFADAEVPMAVVAEGIELRLRWRQDEGRYRGSVLASAAGVEWPEIGHVPLSVASDVSLTEEGVELAAVQVGAPGLRLSGGGAYKPGSEPPLTAAFDWRASLAELPPGLLGDIGASGVAHGRARVRGSGAAMSAALELEGTDLELASIPIAAVGARLEWSDGEARLTRLEARAAGLELSGGARFRSADAGLQAELGFRGEEIGPLLAVAGVTVPGPAGSVEGALSIEGSARSWRTLAGRYRVRLLELEYPSLAAETFRGELRGSLAEGVLTAEAIELDGPGVTARAVGRWQPSAAAELEGRVAVSDWAPTARLLRGLGVQPESERSISLEEMDGALEADFAVAAPLEDGFHAKRVRGTIEVRGARLLWVRLPGYPVGGDLKLVVERGEPAVERGRLDAPGLSVAVRGLADAASGRRYEIELEASDVSPTAAALGELLSPPPPPAGSSDRASRAALVGRLGGGLSLTATVAGWRAGAGLDELNGAVELAVRDIGPGGPGREGLTGSLSARFGGGVLQVGVMRAAFAGLEAEASGRLARDRADDLIIELAVPSLEASVARALPLLSDVGLGDVLAGLPAVSGALAAEVRAAGPWSAPRGAADLTVRGFAIAGHGMGELVAGLESDGGRLRYGVSSGEVGRRIELEGEVDLGKERRATLRGRADRQPLAPFAEMAGWGDMLSGEAEGRVELTWPELRGAASLTLAAGSIAGLAVDRLEAACALDRDRLVVSRGEIHVAGGTLSFGGRLGRSSRSGEIRLDGRDIELGDLVTAFGLPVDLGGTLALEGRLSGSLDDPRLEATVATRGTHLLQRRTPDLSGPVTLDRAGLAVWLSSADATASVRWTMGFAAEDSWSMGFEYPVRLALDRWLAGDLGGRRSIVEGVLRGELRMPAGRVDLVVGNVRLDDAAIDVAGYALRLDGSPEAVLEPDTARLLPLRLRGEGTELTIAAEMRRAPTPTVSLRADGWLDLRALQASSPGLKTGGTATLNLEAGGSWPDFDWRGSVVVRDGVLQHVDLPAALDGLGARIVLAPGEWRLEELGARLGGGRLEALGGMAMAGFEPGDFRFEIDGEGVRLAYPEGFRSQLDAGLVLSRTGASGPGLAGRITVSRGLYDQDIGIERAILARRRALEAVAGVEPDWTDELALDLQLLAPEGLWVRNDLASLEAHGELSIQGSLARPRVSGRIEAVEGGRIFFREVSYYVTRGSFDYLGGSIEDPRLAIRAETSVAEYDVTLTISGRLSAPVFELTSEPSLPTADIVALLVAGATRDQFAATGGGLSQAQAAAYLSSGLTSRLEASLRRSLGLDELKLDPVLVEGQTNPTARVTVGKAISPRLSATYSTRLGSAQRDVYQARYRLRERLDLVGTRDDDGSLSADVRYGGSRLLGVGPTDAEPAAGTPGRRQIREIVVRGGSVADERTLRKLLDLRTGEPFRRARLLEGLDQIRGWYLERRYPEVDTVHGVVDVDDGVRLEVEIDEGREVRLLFPGFEAGRRLERPLLELWQRSLFRDEIASDLAGRAVRILERTGYVSARAEGELRTPAPGVVEAVISIEPGPRVRVGKIALRGNDSFSDSRIREQVLTRSSGWRAKWLDPQLLDEDAEAIRALYTSSGYVDATVSPEVEYPERAGRARVTFVIREGDRFSLGTLSFSGNRELTGEELEAAAGPVAGGPYREDVVLGVREAIERLYDGSGFPDARIETEASVDHEARAVDVTVRIHEGARRRVESIEIVNRGITRESVIRREIELAAGDPMRREALEATQYRLYRTGLFRSVRLERLPASSEESEHLRVRLEEAQNLRFHYGLGFDSEEGPRVTANLAHNNIDGGRLHVGAGGRWSGVDQRFQVLLRNPSMGGARATGLISAYWESEERENFNAQRTGLSLQLGQSYRRGRVSANVGYDVTELDEEQTIGGAAAALAAPGTTRLAGLRLGVARSTRDSSFWPTEGSYARAEATLFHSVVGSEAEFGRLFGQWSRYQELPAGALWSLGVRAGIAQSLGSSAEIPFSERFFAGGDTSLRGFRADSVIASGTPRELLSDLPPGRSLGGDVLLVVNQELMLPLIDPLHALLFYDVGNLYWRPGDFDPTDLRHSVGLGLRLQSPVGPIRLEYGWKLDRRQGESAGQGHFSLGLAF